MRPHKLVMKAFGPFAKETTVDFDAMGNNIYLISGDTGSGKTTIFDGIIYALYGTASGRDRSSLGAEAFHSDYAKDGIRREEMRVEFSFSNADRDYVVTRRMYWGKKGGSARPVKESDLSENGNSLLHARGREDRDEVTAKITQILGLDADQFRRIIMLAQGEFQRFLTARSDERGAILGKLYDNRRHQDFQMRLKAAGAMLERMLKEVSDRATAQTEMLQLPPYMEGDEEMRSRIAADHPEQLSAVRDILEKLDEEIRQKDDQIRAKQQELVRQERQKALAQTRNRLLEDLEMTRDQLKEQETLRPLMEMLRKKTGLAAAAEKLLPAERAMLRAEAEQKTVQERIGRLQAERSSLEEQEKALQDEILILEKKNLPQILTLREQTALLQNMLSVYGDLEKSVQRTASEAEKLNRAKEETRKILDQQEQYAQRKKELEKELQRLEGAGESAVAIAKRRLDDVSAQKMHLEKLKAGAASLIKMQKEAESLAGKLAEAGREALRLEGEHYRLNSAFIDGQAGILAQELRKRLRENRGEAARCPVCGSVHTADDMASFAEGQENIPSREKVDEAMRAWTEARNREKDAQNRCAKKEAELGESLKTIREAAGSFLGIENWVPLPEDPVLQAKLEQCGRALPEAEAAYQKAKTEMAAKEKAMADRALVNEDSELAAQALVHARQAQQTAEAEWTAARTSESHWRQQLKGYPSGLKEAQEKISEMQKQSAVLQKQVDDKKAEHTKCLQDQAVNRGNLDAAAVEYAAREKGYEDTARAFREGLKEQSFTDAAAYEDALSPEGAGLPGRDGISDWISEKNSELTAYEQKRNELEVRVRQLTESTEGFIRTDISVLEAQEAELTGQIEEMREELNILQAARQTDRAVLNRLTALRRERSDYLHAAEKLMPLVEAANGNYAFSRFVLSGFFHRITAQANRHLEVMTDGEYALVPKETGDGRKNIGLELKVLNTITGLERETATLSGGQLFEASLALALGLSDIVQMESASSIQIESMFIDEGFGSLDDGRLDKAISVLQNLSAGRRQIGIISHVARLDECLPKKIRVIAGKRGSSIKIESDT